MLLWTLQCVAASSPQGSSVPEFYLELFLLESKTAKNCIPDEVTITWTFVFHFFRFDGGDQATHTIGKIYLQQPIPLWVDPNLKMEKRFRTPIVSE